MFNFLKDQGWHGTWHVINILEPHWSRAVVLNTYDVVHKNKLYLKNLYFCFPLNIFFLSVWAVSVEQQCELNCRAIGFRFYVRLSEAVTDGTPCKHNDSTLCVAGKCVVSSRKFSFNIPKRNAVSAKTSRGQHRIKMLHHEQSTLVEIDWNKNKITLCEQQGY